MRTNSEEPLFTKTYEGEIPLGIYYTTDGFCVMTSDRLCTFDNNNEFKGEVTFEGKNLLSGKFFDDKILMTYGLEGLSGGTKAVIYNTDCQEIFSYDFNTAISDSVVIGSTYYALSPGTITSFNLETGEASAYEVPTSYASLIAGENGAILFSENQAEVFNPDAFTNKEAN